MNKKQLRKKLALMLANLKKKRRYYCEVEYLKSSGSTTDYQWIDTGFKPTTNTKVRCILACADMGTANNITFYGARTGATDSTNFGLLNFKESGKIRFDRGNYNNSGSYGPLSANTFYEVVQDKNKNYVDGVSAPDSTGTFTNVNYNIFIFGINDNGTYLKDQTQGAGVWKESQKSFKLFQIYDDGVLVRDFIPVLDWNMTPCMYDRVTEQFFYNAGTGDFVAGREIHYVDFLESTGTQYVDTLLVLKNTNSAELKIKTGSSLSAMGIFGSRGGASTNNISIQIGGVNDVVCDFNNSNYSLYRYSIEASQNTDYITIISKENRSINGVGNTALCNNTINTPASAYLFGVSGSPLSTNKFAGKIYYCKIWDDGTLVRDYKPAIDENGVGFMFDRVSHTIYDNSGTGVFKYPARETEYIEVTDLGTNNQNPCIDLGLKYKSSMSIESKYTRTGMGVSGSVLPLSNSTTQPLIYMPALNASAKTDRFVWRRPSLPEASYYYDFADYPMTVEFKVDAVNDALTVNGNVAKTGMIADMNGYTDPYESYSNLYMLSINGTYGGMGKVYYVKLYDTTQVYRDLIPVWKDGVACMYDKQNNVYYSNTKTGTVICGKIIEPEYE